MKKEIFHNYAGQVAHVYGLTREELFHSSREAKYSQARHMLYYLCRKRPMTLMQIQEYMGQNGHSTHHSSIIHGVKRMQSLIDSDPDYMTLYTTINQKVNA